MDFSNYEPSHKLFDLGHKGKLGYLKDEMKGEAISQVCAIRSKCYSILSDSGSSHNRCKGCPSHVTKNVSFETYKNVICSAQSSEKPIPPVSVSFNKIQAKNHQLTTTHQQRAIFSAFDDKRFYTCTFHSAPYGHYREKETNTECRYCLPN